MLNRVELLVKLPGIVEATTTVTIIATDDHFHTDPPANRTWALLPGAGGQSTFVVSPRDKFGRSDPVIFADRG